ncbi:MFS transporter [Pseudonocardia sp. CNS-139]|nr:MFS transporter [Pseudonocardia sp. CNS-139]
MWAAGLATYLVGVMQRTSFGVAGLDAADRFDAGPALLSGFVVLQLVVYAALQVPAGALLDRFGPRLLLTAGAATMAAGQLMLALADGLPLAITARVLVGSGDALTFVSVLAVVGAWFPARRVPVMTQLTGLVGQLGQVLSAVPLAAVLHTAGWAPAFVSAAAWARPSVSRPSPWCATARRAPASAAGAVRAGAAGRARRGLARARHPARRLDARRHAVPGTVFALLWGVPYLVAGQGLTATAAGGLLTLLVAVGIVAGPVFGELTARYPLRRSWLVLSVMGATAAAWTAVLLVPPPAPHWLLGVLVTVLALGGPASVVAFDYARTFNPGHRRGTAVGIVNAGGFSVSVLVTLAVGVLLGAGGGAYTPEAFRGAWTVLYAVWAVAVVGVLGARRRVRRAAPVVIGAPGRP